MKTKEQTTETRDQISKALQSFLELEQFHLTLLKDIELLDYTLQRCRDGISDQELQGYITAAKVCLATHSALMLEKYDELYSDCRKSWDLEYQNPN